VTELTQHVNAQQVAVDRHQAAVDNTQDALDTIFTNWGAEFNCLEKQKAIVAAIADTIEDAHYAVRILYLYSLDDADEVCSADLSHYTRRLRELGLHPTI